MAPLLQDKVLSGPQTAIHSVKTDCSEGETQEVEF